MWAKIQHDAALPMFQCFVGLSFLSLSRDAVTSNLEFDPADYRVTDLAL